MQTATKWTVALVALAALGAGVVAAQDQASEETTPDEAADKAYGKGPRGHAPFWEKCDLNVTVGECKDQLEAEREARKAEFRERCLEERSEEECDAFEQGYRAGRHHGRPGGPGGHGGPEGDAPAPEDTDAEA